METGVSKDNRTGMYLHLDECGEPNDLSST
jgi:hypothetical protein